MMTTNILLGCICGSLVAIAASLARIADVLEEIKRGYK
jgi:hypothetical protein